MIDYIIVALAGILLGFLSMKLSNRLIKVRLTPDMKPVKVDGRTAPFVWMLITPFMFCAFHLAADADWFISVENMILFCIVACLTVCDLSIRRLPNELLLAMIVLKVIATVVAFIRVGEIDWSEVRNSLFGMVVGFGVFLLPSMFRVPIGAGDIKYAAVIGLYFGIVGFLQVMVVMGAASLLFLFYLLIARKGGMKTYSAMGPLLSLGVVVTLFWPVAEGVISLNI